MNETHFLFFRSVHVVPRFSENLVVACDPPDFGNLPKFRTFLRLLDNIMALLKAYAGSGLSQFPVLNFEHLLDTGLSHGLSGLELICDSLDICARRGFLQRNLEWSARFLLTILDISVLGGWEKLCFRISSLIGGISNRDPLLIGRATGTLQ